MRLELLVGAASYYPENLVCTKVGCGHGHHKSRSPQAASPARAPAVEESIPESRGEYAEIYSSKHERLLLRTDHVTKMDTIRKAFNRGRTHLGQRALTTSDIVNSVLDFAFEHRIPFQELEEADSLKDLISKSVYRSAISRWRQFNENF